MIGVVAEPSETSVVQEFFELFKTHWEFYQKDREYDVVLIARGDTGLQSHAKLTITYGTKTTDFEGTAGIVTFESGRVLTFEGKRLPIYGECMTFQEIGSDIVVCEASRQSAIALQRNGKKLRANVGYNLFQEVRVLLTDGQPAANAEVPTIELHIALLRRLIVNAGIHLIEIPPVPNNYNFIACLTHDVDHPSIRAHILDHTILGFLYRALLGSFFKLRHGGSISCLIRNWVAAIKLPAVYCGFARDTWDTFDEYVRIEKGLGSSFFLIPFRDTSGERGNGEAPRRRASRYAAADILIKIRGLMAAGCEIGLHGIDAWIDAGKGRAEVQEIRRLTGSNEIGARMHWLYFNAQSPGILEEAGVDYDLTSGYNETIGYRAGTTQVYRPLGVARLLELPLHVMDTALFFPSHLDLSASQAWKRVDQIIHNSVQFGGCVTVNWHDRSIASERLWGEFYVGLIKKLKDKGAWFPTAGHAVSWFRKRRSAVFETVSTEAGTTRVTLAVDIAKHLPDLQLRVYCEGKIQEFSVGGVIFEEAVNGRMRCTIEAPLPVGELS